MFRKLYPHYTKQTVTEPSLFLTRNYQFSTIYFTGSSRYNEYNEKSRYQHKHTERKTLTFEII